MTLRWYVLHVYSGFEKKVSESIMEQATKKGLTERFAQILVPTEMVTDIQKGKKVQSERKFFPGYVLINMDMTDETWHLVKNTPKVTGFLGSKRPVAMSEVEAMRIIKQVQEGVERPKSAVTFEVGDQVRVMDGPFITFVGTVEEVDSDRGRLKVFVSIFGRATPVELEFVQVEKV